VVGAHEGTHAAFVLVAGGLGERLGYSGIKIALPADMAREACFLQVRRGEGREDDKVGRNPLRGP
jgi:UDP-N-acetylglucosamine pyrophosphorylase